MSYKHPPHPGEWTYGPETTTCSKSFKNINLLLPLKEWSGKDINKELIEQTLSGISAAVTNTLSYIKLKTGHHADRVLDTINIDYQVLAIKFVGPLVYEKETEVVLGDVDVTKDREFIIAHLILRGLEPSPNVVELLVQIGQHFKGNSNETLSI